MHQDFHIDYRHSAGNLHIQLSGTFNLMCAWALYKTIKQQNAGSGRIFVNTKGLTKVITGDAERFKGYMVQGRMPPDWLYFKGEKGLAIAPNGSRVLICKTPDRRRREPFPTLKPCGSKPHRFLLPDHKRRKRWAKH